MKFESDFSIAYAQKRSDVWTTFETILITLLLIVLAYIIHPNDPFTLKGPIPWLVFVPVFCSLFYGAVFGIGSFLILLVTLLYQQHTNVFSHLIIREYVIGSLGFTLLTGIFSSYWHSRIRHVEHLNNYVRGHLENISRDYYLLRISHDRIEQAYIIKPLSFRDAFIQIKEQMLRSDCEINAGNGQMLLGILSQYCSINNAAFCLCDSKSGEINTLAVLGKKFSINAADPLIQQVIKKKLTSYYDLSELQDRNTSAYLAVIPLFNNQEKIIGFVIIKEMPFWSLTHDNLEVLSIFAAYFSLQSFIVKKAQPLIAEFPGCPADFLNEFRILVQLKKHSSIESALSCIVVPKGPQQQNIVYILERQKRSLDYIWVLNVKTTRIVITLMPLTSLEGMLGYRKRIASFLKNEFGLELNTKGLNFRFQQLTELDEKNQLNDFIEEASHAIE